MGEVPLNGGPAEGGAVPYERATPVDTAMVSGHGVETCNRGLDLFTPPNLSRYWYFNYRKTPPPLPIGLP